MFRKLLGYRKTVSNTDLAFSAPPPFNGKSYMD